MDRCLIHPAVKFTCHSYSRPLHNSSTCYSTGAHNISFIKTPCPPPPLLSCVRPHFTWNLFCVCEQPGKRGVQGLSKDSGPRGPPHRDNDDSPPAPPPPTCLLPALHFDTEQRGPFWPCGDLQMRSSVEDGETPAADTASPPLTQTKSTSAEGLCFQVPYLPMGVPYHHKVQQST